MSRVTAPPPFAQMLVALTALIILAPVAEARENVKLLAQKLEAHLEVTVPLEGEAAFRFMLIVQEILDEHPRELEAKLLTRGRLGKHRINLSDLSREAKHWEDANPVRAEELRNSEADVPVVKDVEEARAAERPQQYSAQPAKSNQDGVARVAPPKQVDADAFASFLTPPERSAPAPRFSQSSKSTPAQVFREMRKATVLIYFLGQAKAGNGIVPLHVGTGFFVSPTKLLTNAHVQEAYSGNVGVYVAVNETIGVRTLRTLKNARLQTSVKIDAALMEVVNFRSDHFLPLTSMYRRDEWIAIAGYPGKATEEDRRYIVLDANFRNGQTPELNEIPTAVVDEGRINNTLDNKETFATDLQYTMPTARGNSGSPIVNSCGEVVGLHYYGSFSEVETYSGKQFVKSVKYNQAVSMRDVILFLTQVNANIPYSTEQCQIDF